MPLALDGTSSNVTGVFKGADACRAPEPGTRQRGNTRNNERTAILFFTTTACRCFEGCATSRSEPPAASVRERRNDERGTLNAELRAFLSLVHRSAFLLPR